MRGVIATHARRGDACLVIRDLRIECARSVTSTDWRNTRRIATRIETDIISFIITRHKMLNRRLIARSSLVQCARCCTTCAISSDCLRSARSLKPIIARTPVTHSAAPLICINNWIKSRAHFARLVGLRRFASGPARPCHELVIHLHDHEINIGTRPYVIKSRDKRALYKFYHCSARTILREWHPVSREHPFDPHDIRGIQEESDYIGHLARVSI
jgi:hypothetical protein